MSEALISYEINPHYFRKLSEYNALDPACRLFFRELMDIIWCEKEKFRTEYSPAELARQLGLQESAVEVFVSTLSSDDCKLLQLFYDLESNVLFVSVPYLEKVFRSMESKLALSGADEFETALKAASTVSHLSRVSGRGDSFEPVVGYLDATEIEESRGAYCGWLPTARFADRGEVYYLRKGMIAEMRKKFPGRDIDQVLSQIFDYLIENADRRPFLPTMNRFIARWLTRNTTRKKGVSLGFSDETFSQEEAAFAELLASQISGEN